MTTEGKSLKARSVTHLRKATPWTSCFLSLSLSLSAGNVSLMESSPSYVVNLDLSGLDKEFFQDLLQGRSASACNVDWLVLVVFNERDKKLLLDCE